MIVGYLILAVLCMSVLLLTMGLLRLLRRHSEHFRSIAEGQTIPKIVWVHWQNKKGYHSRLAAINLSRMKSLLEPLGWRIIELDENSGLSRFMYSDMRRVRGWRKLQLQHRTDYLRLKLLTQYGGLWMDAGIYMNEPGAIEIDKMHSRLVSSKKEAVLFMLGEVKPGIPYLENWFIMAKRDSQLLKLWLAEFRSAIKKGFSEYGSQLSGQNVATDRMCDYLTMHKCIQKIIQTLPVYEATRLSLAVELHDAEKDMFALQTRTNWNPTTLATMIEDIKSFPYCKLRGDDRDAVEANPEALRTLYRLSGEPRKGMTL